MGRYTWIKLYTEILDDPKMGRLPDYLWRRAVELFLLAGKEGNDGALPPVNVIGWALRLDEIKTAEHLTALSAVGVVHEAEPGKWVVTHFAKRQAAMTDAERKQKQRAGLNPEKGHKPKSGASQSCHENVTEAEVEVEEESTTTTAASGAQNVFALYQENFGALTQVLKDRLIDLEQTYTPAWVIAAMDEALMSNVRRLAYVESILQRWKIEGFKSKKPKSPATSRPGGAKQTVSQAQNELTEWLAGKEMNVNPA